MTTRRASMAHWKNPHVLGANAGLWLDKFLKDQSPTDTSKLSLVDEVREIRAPDAYCSWFENWKNALREYGAECRPASVDGQMVIGLGTSSVLETSIALHRVFGVPYIPGSALKGMVSRYAREYLSDEWLPSRKSPKSTIGPYEVIFGGVDIGGYVVFFDALPIPGSFSLENDVITVHHKDYYRDGSVPPADWDSPVPVPFLSATGEYLLALGGPPKWVDSTFELLRQALANIGVGGKTSSGYGRLTVKEKREQPTQQDNLGVSDLMRGVNNLKTREVAGTIRQFYDSWVTLQDSVHRRRLAEVIVAKVREAGREGKSQNQDWYKELLNCIEASERLP